jgi:hypothetical protein
VTPDGTAFLVDRTVAEDDPAACPARLVRIELADSRAMPTSRPLFPLPLIYGAMDSWERSAETSLFAVAGNGGRFALVAPSSLGADSHGWSVFVVSATGDMEWEFTLAAPSLRVSDLAWSDDGTLLAWLAVLDDAETNGEVRLAGQEGLYVADIAARSVRLLRRCRGEALAWGPSADRVTLAPAPAPGRTDGHLLRVILVPSGIDVEEFSVAGRVSAIAYTADRRHLAIQTESDGRQEIWVFRAAGGWGRRVYETPPDAGRLSLLGWARVRSANENR